MKRKLKKILSFVLALVLIVPALLFNTADVHAITLTALKPGHINGVPTLTAYHPNVTAGYSYSTGENMFVIYADGVPAFCIEPHKILGTGSGYTTGYFDPHSLQGRKIAMAKWILFDARKYYGGNYASSEPAVDKRTGHDYSLAQLVIWRYTGDGDKVAHFWDENKDNGYMDSAEYLIDMWDKWPDYVDNDTPYEINLGESLYLYDENVGNAYKYVYEDVPGVHASWAENEDVHSNTGRYHWDNVINGGAMKLKVTPTEESPEEFTVYLSQMTKIKRNIVANDTGGQAPILYSHPNQQDIIAGGDIDPDIRPIRFKVNKPQYFDLKVNKQDIYGGQTPSGEASLAGAVFDVKVKEILTKGLPKDKQYAPGTVIGQMTTDEQGNATMPKLPCGTYEIVETKAPTGYTLNPNPIQVTGQPMNPYPAGGISTDIKVTTNGEALVEAGNAAQKKLENIMNAYLPLDEQGSLSLPQVKDNTVAQDGTGVFADAPIMGRISLTKHKDNTGDTEDDATTGGPREGEAGITFDIYDKADQKVGSMTTNDEGMTTSHWLPYGKYRVTQVNTPGDVKRVDDFYVTIDENYHNYHYVLENQPEWMRLRIIKTDKETGKNVLNKDAVFEIYRENGEKVSMIRRDGTTELTDQFIINADGYTDTFERLKAGNYILKEVRAPEGYYLPKDFEVPFTVPADRKDLAEDLTVTITLGDRDETLLKEEVSNTPQKGSLILNKRGELFNGWVTEEANGYSVQRPTWQEGYLPGAVFELRAKEDIIAQDNQTLLYHAGDVVKTITTTADAPAQVTDIPLGTYALVEVSAPTGYLADETVRTVTFTPQAQEVAIDLKETAPIVNKRQQLHLQMTKEMMETPVFHHEEGALNQVVFGLYTAENILGAPADTLVGAVRPDENGIITVSDIPQGAYYFKELETDTMYRLNEENFNITATYSDLKTEDVVHQLETPMVNDYKRGELEITKVDVDTKESLSGAVFRLEGVTDDGIVIPVLNKDGVNEWTVGEDGVLSFKDLELGTYRLTEITAPKGYVVSKNPMDLKIIGDDSVLKVDFNNASKKLDILKIDAVTGEPVVGATLQLLDADENLIEEWVTDGTPHRIEKLEVGKTYILRETKVPEGYLPSKDITFTIDSEEVQEIAMKDAPVPTIQTTATANDKKEVHATKKVTIIDIVRYLMLVIGEEYTVKGVLMNKETGKPLLSNGEEVRSEVTFRAEKNDGSVEMPFTFDASALAGTEVVVFESIYHNGIEIAAHADLTDVEQTVRITAPEIRTTATTADKKKAGFATGTATIVDTVRYTDLIVGDPYTMRGVLMDKATEKPLLINGEEVRSEKRFIAESKDGNVDMIFTFDATGLEGKEVVVFEELLDADGNVIAEHKDINDVGQTVKFTAPPRRPLPKTATSAGYDIMWCMLPVYITCGLSCRLVKRKRR
ncbi:MAG: SpaA isopeptide-forming pilin-related protein [Eubacteriales bacterium]|nr:SpaA isopeptide-forming pilin-related protein [Eubacteriales bacterium]